MSIYGRCSVWKYPLNINVIENEKTFDKVEWDTLWRMLRQYGVPEKLISLICNTYHRMTYKVADVGERSDNFNVMTVFDKDVNCHHTSSSGLLTISRGLPHQAGRMVYFHYFGQSWCKSIISTLSMIWLSFRITKDKCRTKTASTGAGIKIKVDNRKRKITTTAQTPVANVDEPIKVEPFIYPGSMVGTQSGQDRDIKPKIGKASAALTMLKIIWASRFGETADPQLQ